MVQIGDFIVELVCAETKKPFQEHIKDAKVYVEVEPDIEYFISIQKVETSHKGCSYVEFIVDEKRLGYHCLYYANELDEEADLRGLWQVENGKCFDKALKFVKPKLRGMGDKSGSNLLMGKVEVEIYDGIFDGYQNSERSFSSSMSAEKLSQNHADLAAKKSLRSGEGETLTKSERYSTGQKACFTKGDLVDSITLTYCAALGLIAVGVLPKPPHWVHQRMKHPAKMELVPEYAKKARGSGKENDAIQVGEDGDNDDE